MAHRDKQSSLQPPGRPAGKEGPATRGKRHSSAPSMGRKTEPMVTREPPAGTGRPLPGSRSPDEAERPPGEDS